MARWSSCMATGAHGLFTGSGGMLATSSSSSCSDILVALTGPPKQRLACPLEPAPVDELGQRGCRRLR
jgi:hypothetical protein